MSDQPREPVPSGGAPAEAPPTPAYKLLLALGALGVVYGDIGTSPLYAIRESFSGHFGVEAVRANVFGVLSLITWALILVVSVKYLWLVLRADNEGEGGVLALTALIDPRTSPAASTTPIRRRAQRFILVLIGLFGGALLFGDGVITPAISVLSAVEGLDVAAPALGPYVVPLTVLILIGLFSFQRFGTAKIGGVFGPIMMVWFLTLAVLGFRGILREPQVLEALNPTYAWNFLSHGGAPAFLVLGAVFLVVTGSESLYADLGHFGRTPIRLAWFTIVFPALLINYFGQGALVLSDPSAASSPFFLLAPSWARLPLVFLAAIAAVIASQALISGIFSIATQAVQLGFWPRIAIRHTSAVEYGQIYVPVANWSLMVLTVLLVLLFRSSAALTAAYGLAIISTMIVTTTLLFVVAPRAWNWPPILARGLLLIFLGIEILFLLANVPKIPDGGWVPLVIAGGVFVLMFIWQSGRNLLGKRIGQMLHPLDEFLDQLETQSPVRVPGNAVYMTGNPRFTPPPLIKNIEHQKTLHERVILLTVTTERQPHVKRHERVRFAELRSGFYQVTARYGFMENPDMVRVLALLRDQGLDLRMDDTTFFLGRERVLARDVAPIKKLRVGLFSFMSRNSQRATAYFNIPPDRVVEVGSQIEV